MAKNVNAKIQRITEGTLVANIDIAEQTHVARGVDGRGIEPGKSLSHSRIQSTNARNAQTGNRGSYAA